MIIATQEKSRNAYNSHNKWENQTNKQHIWPFLQMSTDGTDDAASIAMAENNNWRGSGATRATS